MKWRTGLLNMCRSIRFPANMHIVYWLINSRSESASAKSLVWPYLNTNKCHLTRSKQHGCVNLSRKEIKAKLLVLLKHSCSMLKSINIEPLVILLNGNITNKPWNCTTSQLIFFFLLSCENSPIHASSTRTDEL